MKKYLIAFLFTITAFVTATSVGAQSWYNGFNPCYDGSGAGPTCACPQNTTYANALGANCWYNCLGTLCTAGCWNPTNGGSCQECGLGGTVTLGQWSCFGGDGGQQNFGTGGQPGIVTCQSNSDCQMYGASSARDGTYNSGPTTGGCSQNSNGPVCAQ